MAMPELRAFAVYIDNKKAATINGQTLTLPPNRQAAYGAEGYLTHSKGAIMSRLQVNEVTPVAASDLVKLMEKHINQQSVTVAIYVAGKVCTAEMAITNLEWTSSTETGMATGTATFEGGVPRIS